MGYSETRCQLCGVSFAIARHRRENEPQHAFWDYSGSPYVDPASIDESCGDATGCDFENYEMLGYQHVAGPECTSVSGYSGHRISMEEMKGCRALQALVKKGQGWEPEDDDEDFEIEGELYLSGISERGPERAWAENIRPARHGYDIMFIDNVCHLSCFVSRANRDQVLT